MTERDIRERVRPTIHRYRRLERILRYLLGAGILAIVVTATAFAQIAGLIVAGVWVISILRVPLFRTAGSLQLRADASCAEILPAFAGRYPPFLGFQWGLADMVSDAENAVEYHFPAIVDRWSRTMTVTIDAETETRGDDQPFDVLVALEGRDWANYSIRCSSDPPGSIVSIDVRSQRWFRLGDLPALISSVRYQPAMFRSMGYQIVRRHYELEWWRPALLRSRD